jgi:hypothetical protein
MKPSSSEGLGLPKSPALAGENAAIASAMAKAVQNSAGGRKGRRDR